MLLLVGRAKLNWIAYLLKTINKGKNGPHGHKESYKQKLGTKYADSSRDLHKSDETYLSRMWAGTCNYGTKLYNNLHVSASKEQ